MFTIQFDYPGCEPMFAGWHKGAAGWAPTLKTATFWKTREDAERWLANGYGQSGLDYGRVIEVER